MKPLMSWPQSAATMEDWGATNAPLCCVLDCPPSSPTSQTKEPAPMADGTLIATIEKNVSEEIRVSLTEFKGHSLVDVRVFAGDGERRATKKGVTFNVSKLSDVIA